jgi:beta-glucosidase
MLVTDWSEIRNQHDWHRVAATAADAVEMAMTETTIDMSMVPTTLRDWQPDGMGEITSAVTSFNTDMAALTAAGKVSQQRVDVAAGRVLQLKEELGLLDDPMLDAARALIPTVGQPEDRAVATDIARESLVLLRNRVVRWGGGHGAAAAGGGGTEAPALPLPPGLKILVTGAAADSLRLLCGGWTNHWQGPVDDSLTEFPHKSQRHGDGGQETVGDALYRMYTGGNVVVQPGYTLVHGQDSADVSKMASAMRSVNDPSVDAIVLVFGEEVYAEKLGDIEDLELPLQFRQYAEEVIAQDERFSRDGVRVPVIAVLVEGRPRLLRGCLDGAAGIVWAGLPGPEGGVAIAELLSGAFSPSGRLPYSYPAKDTGLGYGGQYWHKVTHQCNGPDTLTGAYSDVLDRFVHANPIANTSNPGKKTRLFAPIFKENDHFIKTGSGQT